VSGQAIGAMTVCDLVGEFGKFHCPASGALPIAVCHVLVHPVFKEIYGASTHGAAPPQPGIITPPCISETTNTAITRTIESITNLFRFIHIFPISAVIRNHTRFGSGRTIINLGPWNLPRTGHVGGKIAYCRIPDAEDFW
jgi:hypothetical protein